eukprot:4529967-Heterocapsa_arctica.AAC.1
MSGKIRSGFQWLLMKFCFQGTVSHANACRTLNSKPKVDFHWSSSTFTQCKMTFVPLQPVVITITPPVLSHRD